MWAQERIGAKNNKQKAHMKHYPNYVSKHKGFTLVELMITVAVIGILAAIALPSYTQYIQRSHRSNARNTLIQISQWMERAATATGTYPVDIPQVPPPVPPNPSPIPASLLNVEGGRYTASITTSTAVAYTFSAVPVTSQASDPCGTLVLTQANARTTLASDGIAARSTANKALQSDVECWGR